MSDTITQRDFRKFSVTFHRNGVTGLGFYCCRFLMLTDHTIHTMQALVAGPYCFVTSDNPKERWDGDAFRPALDAAIAAVEKHRPETIHSW